MKYFILTNNPMAETEFGKTHDIRLIEGNLSDVLITARDLINKGAVLLNHPLYGSVKPNETPYRSLLMKEAGAPSGSGFIRTDAESVRLIGNAIRTFEKFSVKKEITDPRTLQDFQVVDLSLLTSAIESADR